MLHLTRAQWAAIPNDYKPARRRGEPRKLVLPTPEGRAMIGIEWRDFEVWDGIQPQSKTPANGCSR